MTVCLVSCINTVDIKWKMAGGRGSDQPQCNLNRPQQFEEEEEYAEINGSFIPPSNQL